MAKRFLPGALSLAMAILSLNFVPPIDAKNRDNLELAAAFQLPELPKLPSLGGASADWRQWDSFFTFIVKAVGQDVSGDLKDSLLQSGMTILSILRSGVRGNADD
jgi:hypothetical protein